MCTSLRDTLYTQSSAGAESQKSTTSCASFVFCSWKYDASTQKKPFSIMHRYISSINNIKWLLTKKHHHCVHLRRLKTSELHKTSFDPHIFSPVTLTLMTSHSILKMETGLGLGLVLISQVYKRSSSRFACDSLLISTWWKAAQKKKEEKNP